MNQKQLCDAFLDYMDDNLEAINAISDRPQAAVVFSVDEFKIRPEASTVWIEGIGDIEIPGMPMNQSSGWIAFIQGDVEESINLVFGDDNSPYTGPGADQMPQKDGIVFAIPNKMLDQYSEAANEL